MLSDHQKTVVAIGGTAIFLLCASQELLSRLEIRTYVNEYRPLIALVALACSAIVLVDLACFALGLIRELVKWQAQIRNKVFRKSAPRSGPDRIVFRMN